MDLGIWKPLNEVCKNWKAESVAAGKNGEGAVEVTVRGSNAEADGGYVIHLDAAGTIKVSYRFSSKVKENPRQWGMVFFAPKTFATLAWQRAAQWSFYPKDHIGRAKGSAIARLALSNQPYAIQPPRQSWPLDATLLGGNDFTSTKVAIQAASLAGHSHRLWVKSDGHQSVRAFLAGDDAGLLVTGFHTGGGDGFFAGHFAAERRPLQPGTELADTIQLQLSAN